MGGYLSCWSQGAHLLSKPQSGRSVPSLPNACKLSACMGRQVAIWKETKFWKSHGACFVLTWQSHSVVSLGQRTHHCLRPVQQKRRYVGHFWLTFIFIFISSVSFIWNTPSCDSLWRDAYISKTAPQPFPCRELTKDRAATSAGHPAATMCIPECGSTYVWYVNSKIANYTVKPTSIWLDFNVFDVSKYDSW